MYTWERISISRTYVTQQGGKTTKHRMETETQRGKEKEKNKGFGAVTATNDSVKREERLV